MKSIIIGAGGYAKELFFLLNYFPEYDVIGFIDDSPSMIGKKVLGKPVLGNRQYVKSIKEKRAIFMGIASPIVRKEIYEELKENKYISYPNIISSYALVGQNVDTGIGNVVMPYATLTADITLGNFNMINIHSTIGHDTSIGNYNTIFPNVNISGNCVVGDKNEFGVGTKIIPKVSIGNKVITGAGSVVITDLKDCTKNVGMPTRVITTKKEERRDGLDCLIIKK
ncbi:acetyltransferase [Enterococcus villorum]|uniref:Acetyltransferase n=1 Tax=Enterococcus villorum TaxID=112904 RepID=A0A511J467_9ENTE|nr:acetyltransferase [Enterococcus villorum]GEL92785.1 acetyltransferase [Enterococcus villorum]